MLQLFFAQSFDAFVRDVVSVRKDHLLLPILVNLLSSGVVRHEISDVLTLVTAIALKNRYDH